MHLRSAESAESAGEKNSGNVRTRISLISQIFIQILSLQGFFYNKSEESALSARE